MSGISLLSADAIRRCLIADPGHVIISADFDQVELRVAAALAGERALIEAAKRNESLHKTVAVNMFGEDYTPDQYTLAKNTDFGWLFGAGAFTIARTAGVPVTKARDMINEFETSFPALVRYKRTKQSAIIKEALNPFEYKAYSALKQRMFLYDNNTRDGKAARKVLQLEIERLCYGKYGWAVTPFGRRMPVEATKAYKVVNYIIQSTASDLMKLALRDVMRDRRCEPYVLLPIHDEILGQAPKRTAQWYADRFAEIMTREFEGVPISSSGKVYGRSWGDGYKKHEKRERLLTAV